MFVVWGLTIVIFNAVGIGEMAKLEGPIATFNMVNFVAVRTHVFFFELQVSTDAGYSGLHAHTCMHATVVWHFRRIDVLYAAPIRDAYVICACMQKLCQAPPTASTCHLQPSAL